MSFIVLGLLGQAGSGKDVVADWFVKERGFCKVSFADPMKSFAKHLFGLNDSQLWGPSEKRNQEFEAGPVFWANAMQHFGRCSKQLIHALFPPDPGNKESLRMRAYVALTGWWKDLQTNYFLKISPRVILQTLGTEWGRMLEPTVWARYLHETVIPQIQDGRWYSSVLGPCGSNLIEAGVPQEEAPGYKGVIIPDHRFQNEVEYTQRHKGFVIALSRPGNPGKAKVVGIPGHASETEQLALQITPDLSLALPEGLELVYHLLLELWEGRPWENGSR